MRTTPCRSYTYGLVCWLGFVGPKPQSVSGSGRSFMQALTFGLRKKNGKPQN